MEPHGLITTTPIADSVWQLTDVFEFRAYLVVGSARAALVDTMGGAGDIRATAGAITSLPVVALLTHCHYDHVGGSYLLDDVRLPIGEKGKWATVQDHAPRAREQALHDGLIAEDDLWAPAAGRAPHCTDVREGDVLDLGGLTLEAVALPGHTRGSMGYLCPERGLLFSGDAVTPIMCLFFEDSLSIAAYRETLRKMEGLDFDAFWTGHHDVGFSKDALAEFDRAAAYAERDERGMDWVHGLLTEYSGTLHVAPEYQLADVDSPGFRAVIGPYVPR